MKKFLLLTAIIFFAASAANAQIISKFNWNANPVTKAEVGPDAISVSSSATSSVNGANGTNGLNPGLPTKNVDLVLKDSSIFNVPSIDIAVDFRREENVAYFYTRKNFEFGVTNGQLSVTFQVAQENGTPLTINSGNVGTVIDDHAFHNYRFRYDNNTGMATIYVDGNTVFTYNGTAGRSLYWVGAGNITIGREMDATSKNVAILDNFIIQKIAVTHSALPLKLLSFTAAAKNNSTVALNWATSEEISVANMVIERSADAVKFQAIKTVKAQNAYTTTTNYQEIDNSPLSVGYYRIRFVDIDGAFTYSDVKAVTLTSNTAVANISCYPNPTIDYVTLRVNNNEAANYRYSVVTANGQLVQSATTAVANGAQQIKIDLTSLKAKTVVIIHLENTQTKQQDNFTIIKS